MILLVDDEPDGLRYARNVLRAAGYTTLSTGNHRECRRSAASWARAGGGRPTS